MATRILRVTLTVAVRDMTEAEYEAEGGADALELGLDEGEDPKDFVNTTEAVQFAEPIEAALESADNPEILAGTGLMVFMGSAHVESIEWSDAA